jgi:ubiquitin carboxyl-terminal hydrolase 5/13
MDDVSFYNSSWMFFFCKDITIDVPNGPIDLTPYRLEEISPNEIRLLDQEVVAEGKSPLKSIITDENALHQLQTMGFSEVRCRKALLATNHAGVEIAMEWLLAHMDDPGKMNCPIMIIEMND